MSFLQGFLPLLKTRIDSIEQYDVVFVGFPTPISRHPGKQILYLLKNDGAGRSKILLSFTNRKLRMINNRLYSRRGCFLFSKKEAITAMMASAGKP